MGGRRRDRVPGSRRPATRSRLDLERLERRDVPAAGLTAEIFDNADFTGWKATRIDPAINFSWGTAAPASGVAADTFSIRWTGRLLPTFSEVHTFFVAADDGFRLWIDDALVAARTSYVAPGVTDVQVPLRAGMPVDIRMEYIEQTGSASARLEWASPSLGRQVIPTAAFDTAPVIDDRGSILSERWSGVTGTTIESLTGNAAYPNRPSERTYLTSFETLRAGQGDDYGRRVRGFLVPPVTGAYRFAIAGDDRVRLLLGTTDSPASAAVIASSDAPTGFREFTRSAGQQSAAITLRAGQRYFIEALQKEGSGGDHLSVAWQRPGDTTWSVIPGDALAPVGTTAALPAESQILATLATGGSRLLVSDERFASTVAAAATSADIQARLTAVVKAADALLPQPLLAYVPDVRGTILGDASKFVGRAFTLGAAYRLTGNATYAERLWKEIEVAAALTDWHPAHFLDTAEMTNALAIAYDWARGYWSADRRSQIVTAIVEKGLKPGLSAYQSNQWFFRDTSNNWALVTNGGMTMGALAVAGDQPALAAQIIARSVPSARAVLRHFTADNGGWYEGPGYFHYTLRYAAWMMASLETALGSDFGLGLTPGFERAGLTALLQTGPTGASFNYADAGSSRYAIGAAGYWMARRFSRPEYAWYARTYTSSADPLGLLWFDGRGAAPAADTLAGDAFFRGPAATPYAPADVVTLRGGWDSAATFVATKAGKIGDSHGNMDAGTFVLDAAGQRWFHDLGGDSYALPGYFSNPQRWTYYRMRAEGQNTLVINPGADGGQRLGATPPVTLFRSADDGSRTVTDLTSAYAGVTSVQRGIALVNGRRDVVVQDEIRAATPATVWWFAHMKLTPSQVQIAADGRSAILTQNGQRLYAGIVAGPDGATFSLQAAAPLPTSPNPTGQNANTGIMKLAVRMTGVTEARLAIVFAPLATGQTAPTSLPMVTPLAAWAAAANTAPTLGSAATAILPSVPAGTTSGLGTTVAALLSVSGSSRVQDRDPRALRGIAVIAADNSNGVWQYSRDGGRSWMSFGTPSATAARLLADAPGNRIRFLPKAGFRGVVATGLTMRAWDQTVGLDGGIAAIGTPGGSSAWSTATFAAGIAVT